MTPPALIDITVDDVHVLLAEDAVLVDVREPHEQARERIAGAIELPLSRLARGGPADLPPDRAVVFLCASGTRTKINSVALAMVAGGQGYNMVGGIAAWKRAGLPTERG
jgi:rhodanese-related sulfurtransferase